ncbi:MAG TPA: MerR family transcriptional regulator [Ruminococcaceae bacterium]|nr:MerR family transcriptional regulator [Oscillospiraceae bacterium]
MTFSIKVGIIRMSRAFVDRYFYRFYAPERFFNMEDAMKNEYRIKELAQLYGVGTDTLRYYERLGLIRPRRGENGYRLYSLQDIYRLTIIRDLRQLGFSTDRISAYLADLNINNTQALLREELQLIRQRLRQLRQIDRAISERQKHLKQYADRPGGQITIRSIADRPCLLFNTDISRDEEVDFAIKKLHNRHADTIRDLGGQAIGAGMRLDEVRAGRFGHYHSVFFLLEPNAKEYDLLLPGGKYACLVYTGSYRAAPSYAQRLLCEINAQKLCAAGDLLELYHIDNRYTGKEEEFVTELQIRIEG